MLKISSLLHLSLKKLVYANHSYKSFGKFASFLHWGYMEYGITAVFHSVEPESINNIFSFLEGDRITRVSAT